MFIKSLKIYGKMDLMWLLRDTKYCIMQIIADIISVLSTAIGMILLTFQLDEMGNLKKNEIYLMLGIAMAVHGMYTLFFANYNNGAISRIISRGQIDHYLLQPIPIWIQVITRGFAPFSGSSQFIISLIIILYSLFKLKIFSIFVFIKVLFAIFCGFIVMISFIYTVSTLSFYIPTGTEEISEMSLELFSHTNYFPLGKMYSSIKILFTFVIPIGFTAWLPTKFIVENKRMVVIALVSIIYFLIAAYSMRRGLSYYVKKGARGYSGFGHR